MQTLNLDFVTQRRSGSLSGWLLLLAGTLSLVACLAWYSQILAPRLDETQARLSKSQKVQRTNQPAVGKVNDKQLAADWARAMQVANDLNLPWEQLFSTLEKATGKEVALLTLDPDAVKHEFALTAEARDLKNMLAFYRRMQALAIFHGVTLHAHQVNDQDSERPIRFRITGKWAWPT